MRELQFLKAFYDAPGHRLRAQDAIHAASVAGFTTSGLADFRTCSDPALRVDGDWWILSSSGQQWYEQQLLLLMSRTE